MRALRQGTERHPLRERRSDLYETPACAIRALLSVIELPRILWDPCAGRGAISRELELASHDVIKNDLVAYPDSDPGIKTPIDFLLETRAAAKVIVCNPPYGLADQFIAHGLDLGCQVVALLRLAALEGAKRSRLVDRHLRRLWVGIERLPMLHREGWAGPRLKTSALPFAWFDFRPDPRPTGQCISLERVSWRRYEK
jgi:hypothetical protein